MCPDCLHPPFQALLCELNLGGQRPEVSRLAVSLSLEGKASHRELTSRLLSDLLLKVLTEEDMARAFDKLLINLPDLILDTPEAPQVSTWGVCLHKHRPCMLYVIIMNGDVEGGKEGHSEG